MKHYNSTFRNAAIILTLILPTFVMAQTSDFAGIYQFKSAGANEPNGTAYIQSESDSTIVFYIKVDNGKSTNQRGFVYGRAIVRGHDGIFYEEFKDAQKPCKLYFEFKNNQMIIESGAEQEECGMGKDVYPDATYKRVSKQNLDEYVDLSGKKKKFKELKF